MAPWSRQDQGAVGLECRGAPAGFPLLGGQNYEPHNSLHQFLLIGPRAHHVLRGNVLVRTLP